MVPLRIVILENFMRTPTDSNASEHEPPGAVTIESCPRFGLWTDGGIVRIEDFFCNFV